MDRVQVATEWRVDAPSEQVWNVLLDASRWPEWWRGFRAVERLADGDDRGIGMRLRQSWRSRLPYTLVFDLEITGIRRLERLEGRATGDVEGSATWTLQERAGSTIVGFSLDVRPGHWWMRLPVPFAGRVFAWNFDTVMRWGGEGLGRVLGVGVAHGPAAERALAPA
jgi:hypothetical protein